jgi:thiol peroxidase
MKTNPLTLLGNEIKIGDQAPDFEALKNNMSPFSLSQTRGKVIIISSMPSVDTAVCELQTTIFNKKAGENPDISVVTISVDLPFALKRFCANEGIESAVTLSDHRELDFGMKYGFVIKELRLLARGVVVIDKNGIIKYLEIVPEISEQPNYDKALEIAQSLL